MLKALKALTGIVAALRQGTRKVPKPGKVSYSRAQAPPPAVFRDGICVREDAANHMYMVTECGPGDFLCDVMIQDGHERWHENSLKKAVQSVISGAKVMNGTVIGIDGVSVRLRSATG